MADRDTAKPEPTMEEILSSIQKIITGDDESIAAAAKAASQPPVPESKPTAEESVPTPAPPPVPVVTKAPEPAKPAKETVEVAKAPDDAPVAEQPKPKQQRLGGLEALVATGLSRFTDKRNKVEEQVETPDLAKTPDKPAAELSAHIKPVENPGQDIVFEPAEEDVLVLTELVKPTGGREARPKPQPQPQPQPAAKPAPAESRPSPAAQALLSPFSGEDTVAKDALESLIKQALQPMLTKWMEDNLEDIVERIVREELHKPVPKK